jgi:ZIP family zinc transporter
VLEAAFWGTVGGIALVIGAAIGIWAPTSQKMVALVMAFGAGVLISALTFELTEEAFRRGGSVSVALGLAGGAAAFFVGDHIVDRNGGADRKRSNGAQADGSAGAIVVGAVLDGIPESVAIGVGLVGGKAVPATVVAAVFLSNIPESLSAATGLQKANHSPRWILTLWTGVTVISAVAAAVGYAVLGDASPNVVGVLQAFAAGAILTMLVDTMVPEAFEHGGGVVGVVTVAGFAVAYLLSTTS